MDTAPRDEVRFREISPDTRTPSLCPMPCHTDSVQHCGDVADLDLSVYMPKILSNLYSLTPISGMPLEILLVNFIVSRVMVSRVSVHLHASAQCPTSVKEVVAMFGEAIAI
jgi:hypothetical protein